MNKLLYVILAAVGLVSCSKTYQITGSTDAQTLDGDKLFVKVSENDEVKNIDSCDVVHGQFHFDGHFDSIQVATISTADNAILPVVLEEGEIKVTLNNTDQSCTGTELNDSLNAFLHAYAKLQNGSLEIQKKLKNLEYRVYTGEVTDPQAESEKIQQESLKLDKQMDDLFTNFVTKNFENVLGPYVFILRASAEAQGYAIFTPWVESILAKAPESFKKNKNIEEFVSMAQKNKNIENGTEQPDQAPIQNTIPPTGQTSAPADMAK